MIEFPSLIIGIVLLLLLLAVAARGWLIARVTENGDEIGPAEDACSAEFVRQVFFPRDQHFVRQIRIPAIESLFHRERKRVARVWIQQASSVLRRVMREHAAVARTSADLHFPTELKIFAQYLVLLFVFGFLSLAIQVVGPLQLGALAELAQELSVRLAHAQRAWQAAVGTSIDAANSR